jgi:hypothetical protein
LVSTPRITINTNPLSDSRINPIEKRDSFQGIFIKTVYYLNQPAFYLLKAVKSSIFEFPFSLTWRQKRSTGFNSGDLGG